ncbi:AAEL008304-PA [Aedes aegypti]|uniref:AAEL008304-PA n=1 Tax=Aedes aegypti TaxID=7159 RepID=Q16Z49_AEDAE|nr:AAEL008304-PA [Aedes aegypti]
MGLWVYTGWFQANFANLQSQSDRRNRRERVVQRTQVRHQKSVVGSKFARLARKISNLDQLDSISTV